MKRYIYTHTRKLKVLYINNSNIVLKILNSRKKFTIFYLTKNVLH